MAGPFDSTSISNEPRNVKQIQNRREIKRAAETTTKNTKDELMNLLNKQQSTSILKTITISKSAYFLFVYDKRQLTDIEKFCCDNQNNDFLNEFWRLTPHSTYVIYGLQTELTKTRG